ncbi:MAG: serine/threonine-protein kinase [Myxococcota bacterium]|nr:serine/threonine-protein kinase [Myxococcota bacterium]
MTHHADDRELAATLDPTSISADEKNTDRAGAVLDGRYRILSRLGAGGFGVVYLAEHVALRRRVAVKLLEIQGGRRPEVRDRFLREARLGAAIRHPNVVAIHDFGFLEDEGGVPFMVMDYLEGEDMAASIDRDLWAPAEAARVLSDVLGGLAALHDLGIVHRDLKPENVFMVEEDGRAFPVLLDFGISRSLGKVEGLESAVPTRDDIVQGTPYYMSPEQAQGRPVDARSDVYSAGVLLYEALSGALPFEGETPFDVVLEVVTGAPRPLELAAPHVPDPLLRVVERAMAKDPAERFADARAMRAALDRAVDEAGLSVLSSLDGWRLEVSGVRPVHRLEEAPPAPEKWDEDLPTEPRTRPLLVETASSPDALPAGLRPRPAPWLAGGLAALVLLAGGLWLAASTGATSRAAVAPPVAAGGQAAGGQAAGGEAAGREAALEDRGVGDPAPTPVEAALVEAPPAEPPVSEEAVAPVAQPRPAPRPRPAAPRRAARAEPPVAALAAPREQTVVADEPPAASGVGLIRDPGF